MLPLATLNMIPTLHQTGIVVLIDKATGESETIKTNSRVFVVPEGSLRRVNFRDNFRMAKVNDIRGYEPDAYLHLHFFATTDDLPPDNTLAPTELEFAPKFEWVHQSSIIDNMRDFFCRFNDAEVRPRRMNSKIWFLRPKKTPCTLCAGVYLPHRDRQRYCYKCGLWFHIECLLDEETAVDPDKCSDDDFTLLPNPPVNTESMDEDQLSQLFRRVLEGPAVRGHGGTNKFDIENNWLNTGSGVQRGVIAEWVENSVVPDDWVKQLGEGFLEDFLGKSWTRYTCLRCGEDRL